MDRNRLRPVPILKADSRDRVNPTPLVACTVVLPLVRLPNRQTETRHNKGEVPVSRPKQGNSRISQVSGHLRPRKRGK